MLILNGQYWVNGEISFFKFYGKGHVEPSNPIYGDEFIRTLIKGDKGAIIDVISHYGIVVIRLDLKLNENCSTESIKCFSGKVSSLKNVDHPAVGSEIDIKINFDEGIEEIDILSGDMKGTHVLIYLENIPNGIDKKEKQNQFLINWYNCETKFYQHTDRYPTYIDIMPKVLTKENKETTKKFTSMHRFSYDGIISDSNLHSHLDYQTISDHLIDPSIENSLRLNLTTAFEKANEEGYSNLEIKSRHYALTPDQENPLENNTIYDNSDEVLFEFEKTNDIWVIKESICDSFNVK